jgi:hypothetical protein
MNEQNSPLLEDFKAFMEEWQTTQLRIYVNVLVLYQFVYLYN